MGNFEQEYSKYEKVYSESSFWEKIKEYAIQAGCSVIYAALLLYYVMNLKEISSKERAIVWSALGYFILPLDVIPDVMPVVGFTDDLAVLIAALYVIVKYIDEDVKKAARNKLKDWFGNKCKAEDLDAVESKLPIKK